jgi:hypothetical protein
MSLLDVSRASKDGEPIAFVHRPFHSFTGDSGRAHITAMIEGLSEIHRVTAKSCAA